MKALGVICAALLLGSCTTSAHLTASECQAKYDALQAKSSEAWLQADHGNKDSIAKAAEVAADSAQQAADLSAGQCKQFDRSKPGRARQL